MTRIGGIVAACQWDFAGGMPIIAGLRQALQIAAPGLCQGPGGASQPFESEADFRRYWENAGLRAVETGRIAVALQYESFADLWRPLLGGSTPTTALLASLPPHTQAEIRRRLRETLVADGRKDRFTVAAAAFAVRGLR